MRRSRVFSQLRNLADFSDLKITRITAYQVDLPLHEGEYHINDKYSPRNRATHNYEFYVIAEHERLLTQNFNSVLKWCKFFAILSRLLQMG